MSGRRTILTGAVVVGITIPIVILLFLGRGPEPMDLTVGSHLLTIPVPRGFEAVEQEDGWLIRDGLVRVTLSDLGPFEPGRKGHLPFDDRVQIELYNLGFTVQREISRRDSLQVQGRTFRIIKTWDRLTHDHPLRYAFVPNGGALLVVLAGAGEGSRSAMAWDEIMRSITFRDP